MSQIPYLRKTKKQRTEPIIDISVPTELSRRNLKELLKRQSIEFQSTATRAQLLALWLSHQDPVKTQEKTAAEFHKQILRKAETVSAPITRCSLDVLFIICRCLEVPSVAVLSRCCRFLRNRLSLNVNKGSRPSPVFSLLARLFLTHKFHLRSVLARTDKLLSLHLKAVKICGTPQFQLPPVLTELVIERSEGFSATTLMHMIKNTPRLQTLKLSRNYLLFEKDIVRKSWPAFNLPELTKFQWTEHPNIPTPWSSFYNLSLFQSTAKPVQFLGDLLSRMDNLIDCELFTTQWQVYRLWLPKSLRVFRYNHLTSPKLLFHKECQLTEFHGYAMPRLLSFLFDIPNYKSLTVLGIPFKEGAKETIEKTAFAVFLNQQPELLPNLKLIIATWKWMPATNYQALYEEMHGGKYPQLRIQCVPSEL